MKLIFLMKKNTNNEKIIKDNNNDLKILQKQLNDQELNISE